MIPQRDSRDTTMGRCISGSVPLVSRASTNRRLSEGLLHKIVSSACLGSVACPPSNAKVSALCLTRRQYRLTSLSSTCVLANPIFAAKRVKQPHSHSHSHDTSSRGTAQVQTLTATFRKLLLVNARLSTPQSTRTNSRPSNRKREIRRHQESARPQNIRSRDTLLEELTSIASEVTGTTVSADAPLMSAGLDSISAMEL